MSKLKVAKVIHKSLMIGGKVIKWTALALCLGGLGLGLWAWANAHFLSFAIVIGIILAIAVLAGVFIALEWSEKVIKEAKEEEQEAQKRDRLEKAHKEQPATDSTITRWFEEQYPHHSIDDYNRLSR